MAQSIITPRLPKYLSPLSLIPVKEHPPKSGWRLRFFVISLLPKSYDIISIPPSISTIIRLCLCRIFEGYNVRTLQIGRVESRQKFYSAVSLRSLELKAPGGLCPSRLRLTNLEVSKLSGTHVGRFGAKRTSLEEFDMTSRALPLGCCALEVVA